MSNRENQSIHARPAELLQNLIRFDTSNPPGNEADIITYLHGLFKQSEVTCTILARDPGRPNLLARLPGRGDAPPLMLYAHVDVVPTTDQQWTYPPFEGRLVDGYIWGRGALDVKCGVAMMVAALLRAKADNLVPAGDILLLADCDEECRSNYGAKFLVEKHAHQFEGVRYALGEFGGFPMSISGVKFYLIQVAEKQACWMKATVRGPGGHGSLPMRDGTMARLGQVVTNLNRKRLPVHITPAVRAMFNALAAHLPFPQNLILRQMLNPLFTDRLIDLMGERGRLFEPLLHNTVNATIVRGGEKVNVIPSQIELELDGRLLPGFTSEDMLGELRQLLGDLVELQVLSYDEYPTEPDLGLFDLLAGVLKEADPQGIPIPYVIPAVTDAVYFARLGIQTYGFTPMNLPEGFDFFNTIHAADERIPVEAVEFGTQAIYRVLECYNP
jgi:acetylornithine deacetylase/succinyl-diaminopimelate desuccinylase-like protein